MCKYGTAHDWDFLHVGDFGGRVPRFAFARRTVYLDELRKVYVVAEGRRHRRAVGRESVAGYLNVAVRRSRHLRRLAAKQAMGAPIKKS